MYTIIDLVYLKLRRKEVAKAQKKLNKITISTIFKCIAKNCWENNINYEVLFRSSNILVIKIIGTREDIIIKYHRTDMVSQNDFIGLMQYMEENFVDKGVYITTGIFDRVVFRRKDKANLKKIKLENGIQFLKRHLGLLLKAEAIFNHKKFSFHEYIPQ
ncbi:MAG: hypothetical protein Q8936_09010 [Bacillota bacterium]|nr:hypothetical protein [Bacillota bacterium]